MATSSGAQGTHDDDQAPKANHTPHAASITPCRRRSATNSTVKAPSNKADHTSTRVAATSANAMPKASAEKHTHMG